jgi:hypothetical protein
VVLAGCAGGSNPASPLDGESTVEQDRAAFCSSVLDDVDATLVTDGMDADEVLDTMRFASRHYTKAADLAPSEIKGEVLQVAANYLSLAEAMEGGEAPFQVLLSPPVDVDLEATEAVGAYLEANCR